MLSRDGVASAGPRGAYVLILVGDNTSYSTFRWNQERDYSGLLSGPGLVNPEFAALARAYGSWAGTVERTKDFAPALARTKARSGVKLLHLKTDVENITANTTITALRERARNR